VTGMRGNPDNLRQAAARNSAAAQTRAEHGLRELIRRREPITFRGLAQTAGVSLDFLYRHNEIRRRVEHLRAQQLPIDALTPDTAWTIEYYGLAVESMRAAGRRIDDEVLAHISPVHSENINCFGSIDVDIEGELAQLGPTGYRPLRVRDTLF
jgi:hypothetical protein